MKCLKENWKFLLIITILCIIGGFFIILYTLDSMDPKLFEEGIKQAGSLNKFIGISVIAVALYGLIFGSVGILLSSKIGLWRKFEKNSTAIKATIIISIIGGLAISVLDKYVFGYFIEPVKQYYETPPTIEYIIGSFAYGGVFEEILLRLFLMSLMSLIIYKLFFRKETAIPTKVFIVANLISALVFAAGHIPATEQLLGYIDGMILLRCFLLNGLLGLTFGWLYRKYSIHYSMLAHFGCHFVSKVILLLLV